MASNDRVWLFDLDNTLHDATPGIFPRINRAMRAYIERHLGVSAHEADRLRLNYWQRYGATLLGMIRHHRINPHHFLDATHQFPDLAALLVFRPETRHALSRLPGKKILFSNAPAGYTKQILTLTRLAHHFDAVYTVESLRFRPKPQLDGFLHLLRQQKLNPRQCVMVEDSLANLVTAKRLGMSTVWVSTSLRRSPWVDVTLRQVSELPGRLGEL